MTDQGHSKSSITLTGVQLAKGYGPGTPLTQAIVDATRALLAGGGHGDYERVTNSDATTYTFTGPPELVQAVTRTFMAWIFAQMEQAA